jgi:hypothetical protein
MKRIPPSQKSKEELKDLLQGKDGAETFEELRGRLVRLATEHIVEAALEAEWASDWGGNTTGIDRTQSNLRRTATAIGIAG